MFDDEKKLKYERVAARIRSLIEHRQFVVGDRLPSVRSIAGQMNCSVITVLEGYRQLEAEGIVRAKPRSGYYVDRCPALFCSRQNSAGQSKEISNSDNGPHHVQAPRSIEMMIRAAEDPEVLRLGVGTLDNRVLPNKQIAKCVGRVLRDVPDDINQYDSRNGVPQLLRGIARIMVDGGCTPRQGEIRVTAGGTQGLILALRALVKPGETVAVESPGYSGFYAVARFLGLKVIEVHSDPVTGLDPAELQRCFEQKIVPAALLLSADFSVPTGAYIPDENRPVITGLCRRFRVPVIEDATYNLLHYHEGRPRSLKCYDPENVVQVVSLNKLLLPGYRIGWIAGGEYCRDIDRCHHMGVLSQPRVVQMGIAAFLEEGHFNRSMRKLRRFVRESMIRYQKAVKELFPAGCRFSSPEGGQFLWIELPVSVDANELVEEAFEREKIFVCPGGFYSGRDEYQNCIRINVGIGWNEQVERALRILGRMISQQISVAERSAGSGITENG